MKFGGLQSRRENADQEENLLSLPGIEPGHPTRSLQSYQSAIQDNDTENKEGNIF